MIRKQSFTVLAAFLLVSGMSPVLADATPYQGTATLCFIGAVPPSMSEDGESGVRSVSGLVALYYIQTAPPGIEPPVGLVNGWELLTSDMKINGETYRIDWKGVLVPAAYVDVTGTALEETASVETTDLSTLSGTWQGSGDLAGTRVDYVLKIIPGATPNCPKDHPPQCADIEGGCLPAEPPAVGVPVVYDMSGTVN